MKNVNWRVVTPILILGVALVWQMIRMASKASDIWSPIIFLGLPLFTSLFGLMAMAMWFRRRKSTRTWDLMLEDDANATHFIAFVYPPVKTQLTRLGWRSHGATYAYMPAVGVSVGPAGVNFWEAGVDGPTLIIETGEIQSAAIGRVSDGYRYHPAIELTLNTENRSNRVQLDLRNVDHSTLTPAQLGDVLKLFPVGPRPSTHRKRIDE